MAIQKTEKIWHNGKFIRWDDAHIHVMSHVVNYGSSVFEGIRCYALPSGPAIFRAQEHMQRLLDSAKIYRIDVEFTRDELVTALVELVKNNGVWPCYIRPIVLRGYGEAGVNPFNSPTEVYVVNYPWGKYLGTDAEQGVDVCVSSWTRIAPNTLPAMAKSGANYMNSQLVKMEAIINGYVEGIALDANGYVSEGSGENLFVVRNGTLQTAPLGNSVLPGITRDSVLRIARELGIAVVEQCIPRELLYIADELFLTGTAAEITAVRSVDKISVGKGKLGPITRSIQKEFYAIIRGEKPDRFQWLTPVPVGSKQPVGVQFRMHSSDPEGAHMRP
ncbi:MAG: branched chain amino acid aminotransferase [Acidobacteria bacterium]|nr:MAG: branched chain amino acid aminotransferase [Acidobacteriota bacterium]